MPCLNEEGYIEACIDSVLAQDYPRDKLEILARISARDARVRMIDNPARIQAPAMNLIIAAARGDVIIRMDVHCEYSLSYVRKCVEVLERTGADNVGGAQRSRGRTSFQKAVCAALASPLGVGGAKYRDEQQEGFVDTVFLGAWRRSIFEKVGLYDAGAVTNEDAELNQRILASGGKIYLSREIVVHYYPRNSWTKLSRQYFKYGEGRARTFLKHRRLPTVRPLLPFLATTSGAMLLATSFFQPFTLPIFGLYALLAGLEAVRVGRAAGLAAIPLVWAMFPVLHVSHGVGFAAGLMRYARRPDWSAQPSTLEVSSQRRVA